MAEHIRNPDEHNGENKSSQQWMDLLFNDPRFLVASNIQWIPNGPLGNSRLASDKELISLRQAAEKNTQDFVRLLSAYGIAHSPHPAAIDMGNLPLPLGIESPNLLVFGRSGSGKTQTVMLPVARHALEHNWSMVYVNVKGVKQTRLLRRMAKQFGRNAQTLAPTKRNRTIACTLIDGCNSLSKANEPAEGIVACAAMNSRNGEGAWAYNQAKEWTQNAIAAICDDSPKSERNLVEIRRVVQTGAYQEFANQHPDFPVLARFAKYVADGNKNAETITATIAECTAFIDEMEEFLSKSEFRFDRFAKNGGVLIIEIDQSDVRKLRPFVTIFLTRFKASLQREANSQATGRLPNKTVFIIDELIASGPIPGLAEDLHTCRELNFCFVAGAQSISQIATIYGAEAQAVLDGFQTQIAIPGGLDCLTAEHFSRRSGIATIALPGVNEPSDSDGDIALSRHWQLSSRPVLLASEVASPQTHPLLGMPATIIAGDGKTPPFQAYLTPFHQHGGLAKLQDEVVDRDVDDDLRKIPLKRCRKGRSTFGTKTNSASGNSTGISNTKGWSDQQLRSKYETVLAKLDWANTTGSARKWWSSFEEENKSKFALVLQLAEELALRKATITEFFLAYVYSNTSNIQSNLHYLDYTRLKKEEENKRKVAQEDFAQNNDSRTNHKAAVTQLDINATTGFQVLLTAIGDNKQGVIKVVMSAIGKSLSETKQLIENIPCPIGRTKKREDALKIVQDIKNAGGQAHLV